MSAAARWWWAGAWLALSCTGALLLGHEADRYPVSAALIAIGLITSSVAIDVVLKGFGW